MAPLSHAHLCQERDSRMKNSTTSTPTLVAGQRRPPPVRVKIRDASGRIAKVHPPDGESDIWWERLNKALGTTSSDFVNASLFQIQAAARSPLGGVSELAINAPSP